MYTDVYELGVGIGMAFIMPIVGYIVGLVWLGITGNRNLERSWRMCCIMMPVVFLGLKSALQFDLIKGVWRQWPALAVIIYSVVGILIPAGLIRGFMHLWRT